MKFDVYELDMWSDGDGGWTENSRSKIGSLELPVTRVEDVTGLMVLETLVSAEFTGMFGRSYRPLTTKDRRRVYAEDCYGDGRWWEVGAVKEHYPMYGLSPVA